jgi:hypothetical protein
LLGEQRAQPVFTDPSYNVPISGHVGGLGSFSTANLLWRPKRCRRLNSPHSCNLFSHLATHSIDGSIHFQCMDWRHVQEILAAGTAAYTDLKNICV